MNSKYTQLDQVRKPRQPKAWLPMILNFSSMALQVLTVLGFSIWLGHADAPINYFHGFAISSSVAYHLLPCLTRNVVFRFFAHFIGLVIYTTLFYSLYLLITVRAPFEPISYLIFLGWFTLPASLTNASLVWLMYADLRLRNKFLTRLKSNDSNGLTPVTSLNAYMPEEDSEEYEKLHSA